ncbi:MAG: CAAX prenyl protease-related protein [Mariniblastus sp.]|nr:CAAX prenyl protease-related protein [Mariniblastus sp.]
MPAKDDSNEPVFKPSGKTGSLGKRLHPSGPQPDMIAFLLPLITFMFMAGMSPNFEGESPAPNAALHYLWLILAEVAVLTILIGYFWRVYLDHFPFRINHWGVIAGAAGIVLWVGVCSLHLESSLIATLGLSEYPARPGFNPYANFSDRTQFIAFVVSRFILLSLLVPLCEELFLRGWLVRYVENPNWQRVYLAQVGWRGCLAVAIYAAVSHPAEIIAAVAWFSLISWLMIKTGKFWNCVLAHSVTNFLLGLYVMRSQEWQYW